MLLAVAIPIVTKTVFPEVVSKQAKMVFDAIEDLPEGSNILLSYDFDPASQGELLPMSQAFTRHCSIKGHKQYYMALWPLGSPMVDLSIDTIESEYPDMVYGKDYMKFDYKNILAIILLSIVASGLINILSNILGVKNYMGTITFFSFCMFGMFFGYLSKKK